MGSTGCRLILPLFFRGQRYVFYLFFTTGSGGSVSLITGPPSVAIWHSGWLSSSLVRIPPRSEKRMRRLKASGLLEPLVLCPPITRAGWWASGGMWFRTSPRGALDRVPSRIRVFARRTDGCCECSKHAPVVASAFAALNFAAQTTFSLLRLCSGCRPYVAPASAVANDACSTTTPALNQLGAASAVEGGCCRVRNSPWWNWEASGGLLADVQARQSRESETESCFVASLCPLND